MSFACSGMSFLVLYGVPSECPTNHWVQLTITNGPSEESDENWKKVIKKRFGRALQRESVGMLNVLRYNARSNEMRVEVNFFGILHEEPNGDFRNQFSARRVSRAHKVAEAFMYYNKPQTILVTNTTPAPGRTILPNVNNGTAFVQSTPDDLMYFRKVWRMSMELTGIWGKLSLKAKFWWKLIIHHYDDDKEFHINSLWLWPIDFQWHWQSILMVWNHCI